MLAHDTPFEACGSIKQVLGHVSIDDFGRVAESMGQKGAPDD